MKILIMIMMLIFGQAVFAHQNREHEELFSLQDNEKIVRAIDFICGDIWCEGYYEYKFIKLSCDKLNQDCRLNFQFKESIDDQKVVYSPVQVCHIEGIQSLDQVMADDQYLRFEFIDKLNNCFGELAEQYRNN